MNGIHDMGGMHGFGPVQVEQDEPLFHAAWEGRVVGMTELVEDELGLYNLDEFRYGIEQMEPAAYLRSSYFERWLATIEYNLIQKGVFTPDELDARTALMQHQPAASLPDNYSIALPSAVLHDDLEPESSASAPRFAVGDAVETRNMHPKHHTRLPRYARGKRGVIQLVHGPEVFPDTNAHGLSDAMQVCYSVRFTAQELWGESAEPRQTVSIDLWENYLEPAPS